MKRATEKGPAAAQHQPEHALLEDALKALEEATGATANVLQWQQKLAGRTADAVLQVKKGGIKARYVVEIKRTLPAGAVGHMVAQVQGFNQPAMLVTRYITPPVAERLKALDMAFLDTAGNVYINTPQLFVYVTGRKAPEPRGRPLKAFRPTGLQVIFALLCMPDLIKAPYRDIAKAADVALGTVGWVMVDLKHLAYLIERGKLGRKLVNKRKLLDAWVTAYAQQLQPKCYVGRFRAADPNWWHNIDLKNFNAFLGGEPAAAKLTQYLRPGTITIYAGGDVNAFLLAHRLRKDTAGDVELLKPFWHFDVPWQHTQLVPPLLVYADLVATGDDRNIETGKLIYEQYLAGLVRED